jgi:hypothetical protein
MPKAFYQIFLTKLARKEVLFGELGGGVVFIVRALVQREEVSTPCDLRGANRITSVQR